MRVVQAKHAGLQVERIAAGRDLLRPARAARRRAARLGGVHDEGYLEEAPFVRSAGSRRSLSLSKDYQCRRLKNWISRSCFSAASRVSNVPRLRRLPVGVCRDRVEPVFAGLEFPDHGLPPSDRR